MHQNNCVTFSEHAEFNLLFETCGKTIIQMIQLCEDTLCV